MGTERVDKAWQRQGLKNYSTEAIVGTLVHYGARVSEEDFRQEAEKATPLQIAATWMLHWKGTGPFKHYPFDAAIELWRRWTPGKLAPQQLTEALAGLMNALVGLLKKLPQAADVGPAFERAQALRQQVPLDEKGLPQRRFIEEALAAFDERVLEQFDGLAETLATDGHVQHAEAFADLEEFLLPERRGVSKAITRAARGEKDAAVEELVAIAKDSSRTSLARLLGIDGLIHLDADAQVLSHGRALMEEAEKGGDLHLALDLVARLEHVLKARRDRPALEALAQDVARLEAAHDKAHPGHRHKRHQHR